MRSIHQLFLVIIILTLALNGCGSSPTPTDTQEVPLTATSTRSAPPVPATPTPTLTSIPTGKTIVITSASDSGPCTLRQALEDARPGDNITFDPAIFPPDVPVTIVVSSSLPDLIQGNLIIDASYAGVILDGKNIAASDDPDGITILSNGNNIRGMQIVGFPGAGIALRGGAQNNVVGGDRSIGTAPLGQGNLVSGNGSFGIGLWDEGTSDNTIQGNYIGVNLDGTGALGHPRDGIHSNGANQNLISSNVIGGNDTGVYLCCVAEGKNVVTNNIIGTDPSGAIPIGNITAGVLVDRSNHNIIGPGNLIAYNNGPGVMFWEDTSGNTVTQNSIHNNGELPTSYIALSQARMATPRIFDFDLDAGSIDGVACPNCVVEVFSDTGVEGAIYEGRTIADENGVFELQVASVFSGPHLTTNATDPDGTTSIFSVPTTGARQSSILQIKNAFPRTLLVSRSPQELENTEIGDTWAGVTVDNLPDPAQLSEHSVWLGHTWICLTFGEREWAGVESTGSFSPVSFGDYEDQVIDHLNKQGITIVYNLTYFDRDLQVGPNFLRFQTEQEIQDYLDYADMVATHFKGRIQYYETWNEPNNNSGQQGIAVDDYINVIRRLIPVIHSVDPQAKIVIGGGSELRDPYVQAYLMAILESDLMPLVDGIAIHPMYGSSPAYDELRQYYYDYPALIQRIKNKASAHGFTGEYFSEEMLWRSSLFTTDYEVWTYTETVAAKYYARGIVINRGLGLYAGIGGECYDCYPRVVHVVQNLNSVLAGAQPTESLPIQIKSEAAADIRNYWFSLHNGDYLVALWTDGVAVDDDPGIKATLILPNFLTSKVVGIDILYGFEQQLIVDVEDGNLVMHDLLVKDYPIILRFKNASSP